MNALALYVGRVREFQRTDWMVYVAWVGLISGLFFATGGFLYLGRTHGVQFPGEAYMVPVGALIFAIAIAVDTIGHRTVYKEEIRGAEGLVHQVTIFCGIGSCVLLCASYQNRDLFSIPAMVLTVLSFVYSLIDEAFHWRRYLSGASDRVEMWSHTFIFIGHGIMMLGWWRWFFLGYPGVSATVSLFRS
ncbi:MAG: hypothetical protein ACXWUG_10225 [Polyangiales bacterium]